MAGILLSGPAGAGKSEEARRVMAESNIPAVVIDFQAIYAALLLLDRDAERPLPGTPRERQPFASPGRVHPPGRNLGGRGPPAIRHRDKLRWRRPTGAELSCRLLGAGGQERIIDPGREVVTQRLSTGGQLSNQCTQAIQRWYGRL